MGLLVLSEPRAAGFNMFALDPGVTRERVWAGTLTSGSMVEILTTEEFFPTLLTPGMSRALHPGHLPSHQASASIQQGHGWL